MAKLTHLSRDVIKGFHGELDFYYWKGIPVCRMWPDYTKFKPGARQKESMAAMTESRRVIKTFSPGLVSLYRSECIGSKAAWLDVVTGMFLSAWKDSRKYPSVLTDVKVEDLGDEYKVSCRFSHNPLPKAKVLGNVRRFDPKSDYRKGATRVCPRPPWGFYIPDPIYPQEPLEFEPEFDIPEHIDIPISFGYGARRVAEAYAVPKGTACGAAWAAWAESVWEGHSGSYWSPCFFSDGGPFDVNSESVKIRAYKSPVAFDMQLWDDSYPEFRPPAAALFMFQDFAEPIGSAVFSALPDLTLTFSQGWNEWLFLVPESWKTDKVIHSEVTPILGELPCPVSENFEVGFRVNNMGGNKMWLRFFVRVPYDACYHIPKEFVDFPDPHVVFDSTAGGVPYSVPQIPIPLK